MDDGRTRCWKVGELAEATGLTVRTLHHWDELGLLTPSGRTASGHRLYDAGDVRRCYAVLALRELGLPLDAVGEVLAGQAPALGDLLAAHVGRVREQLAALRSLESTLSALLARTARTDSLSSSDLLALIDEVTTMDETVKRYYTAEQLDTLRARRERLGEDTIAQVQAEWPTLIARVQAEMDAGTDPGEPRVQGLAARWMELLEAFDGGDPAIRDSATRLINENPVDAQAGGAPSPEMIEYVAASNRTRG